MKRTCSIDAPDQQRLKIARAEIEAVLKKHDLAGVAVLHTPGMTEFFYDIQPSYSVAWVDEASNMVRLKSKLADYGGDAQAQINDQAATAQMLHAFGMDCGKAGLMFLEVAKVVDRKLRAEHTPPTFVPDPMEGKRQ